MPKADHSPADNDLTEPARSGKTHRRLLRSILLVGLVILAPATAQTDDPVQVAAVTPPFTAPPESPPSDHLLSEADVERYGRIFAAQDAGDWTTADAEIAEVQDRRLMGHVLAQRLLHPDAYVASYAELRDWLASYADHPQAERIHDLALRRRPSGAAAPRSPEEAGRFARTLIWRLGVPRCPALNVSSHARETQRRIRRYHYNDQPERALAYLEGPARAGLTEVEFDRLRGDVAAGFYDAGATETALEHAAAAAERSGGRAEHALWIAGLSQWRLGNYAAAAARFESLSDAECSSAWEMTAGAYWAARAHTRAGNFAAVSPMLSRAARYPRTFYGLLARRALGIDIRDFDFDAPTVTPRHVAAIAEAPSGRRALGLLQVGDGRSAERELMRIIPNRTDRVLEEALIAVAQESRLPRLAIRLAHARQPQEGGYYDGALYPLGPWRPENGFAVEQALVHAIIREESHFNPEAVSIAGASGLMQLMPSTAAAMADQSFRGARRDRLFDPDFNLMLGQAYLVHLLEYRPTGSDLIRILVSYNAGPGSLLNWVEEVEHDDDPLLFIESIPSREARAYAERVMASFWIYRMRLGQPTPSLDDLAGGTWPVYRELAPSQVVHAWR